MDGWRLECRAAAATDLSGMESSVKKWNAEYRSGWAAGDGIGNARKRKDGIAVGRKGSKGK